ncbi:pyridoxal phosphate-dependent transferase [Naviculisporaceae sp. PSN 640]
MATKPLFPVDAFHTESGVTYLHTAGEGLPPRVQHQRGFERYVIDKSQGAPGRARIGQEIEKVRRLAAKIWSVKPEDIGFVSNVAEGVTILLESIDWHEGDNVVLDPREFPSVAAPFALRARRPKSGVAPETRFADADSLERVVNSKTRIIAISYVSFLDGNRVDLNYYRRVADRVGAILVVDYSQASGWAPIDATIADFAFGVAYKWLLGATGTAIAYWNRERQPKWQPATAGWFSLASMNRHNWETGQIETRKDGMCFARGNPSHPSIYVLGETLTFLSQWDPVEIEAHVQSLTDALLEELECAGIVSSTPREKKRHGASVCIETGHADSIVADLAKVGIYASGGVGRIRFSFHGHNKLDDVKRLMDVFPGIYWRYHRRTGGSKL